MYTHTHRHAQTHTTQVRESHSRPKHRYHQNPTSSECFGGCLQECEWGVTYGSRNRTPASPKTTRAWVTAYKNWGPGTQLTGSSTGWSLLLPSGIRRSSVLQVALSFWLLSISWACHSFLRSLTYLKVTLSSLSCFLWEGGGWWIWSVLETSWSYFELFTFCLKVFPLEDGALFSLGENCYTAPGWASTGLS